MNLNDAISELSLFLTRWGDRHANETPLAANDGLKAVSHKRFVSHDPLESDSIPDRKHILAPMGVCGKAPVAKGPQWICRC